MDSRGLDCCVVLLQLIHIGQTCYNKDVVDDEVDGACEYNNCIFLHSHLLPLTNFLGKSLKVMQHNI